MIPYRYGVGIALACALVALIGCNDATGGGGYVPPPYTGPTVQVTGRVTYTRVLVDDNGMQFATQTNQPIRGAVIEIRDQSNRVVATGNTDSNGNYVVRAAQNQPNTLRVKAALGSPDSPNTYVVDADIADPNPPASDPLRGKALFVLDNTITATTVDLVNQNFNAASGISTAGVYDASRPAAAFAILDVIYRAQVMVRLADPSASFPLLTMNWDDDLVAGYYDPSESAIYLSGDAADDTDEYDTHVIAHEWGHYFEDHFSRSDNLGGAHSDGDYLDDSVAFGEGFGNAISGMVMGDPATNVGDPIYVDTSFGDYFSYSLEADQDTPLIEGYWCENSIGEILYDIYDNVDDGADTVSLGFAPIYQAMTGPQVTSVYFTSIFTFLQGLAPIVGGPNAGIVAAIAANENIGPHDDHQLLTGGRYLSMLGNGSTAAGVIEATYTQGNDSDHNKLFARVMIRCGLLGSGPHRITVTPSPLNAPISVRLPGVDQEIYPSVTGQPLVMTITPTGNDLIFSVGLAYPATGRTIPFTVTVEMQTSPIAPAGNG